MISALTASTPDGPFSIIANDTAVLASGWTTNMSLLLGLIHASLRPSARDLQESHHTEAMRKAHGALDAFYAGDPSLLAAVPVTQKSGPFREHAWNVLRTVAPGEVVTYTQYAAKCDNARAVRAAASACANNAAALFVPCHRVIRTDGTLGGFAYGLDIKERLLAREQNN